MRLLHLYLDGHRSVEYLDFEAAPFTVLFGKNNSGKTNLLETVMGILAPAEFSRHCRRTHLDRGSRPMGGLYVELTPGFVFDDAVASAVFPERNPAEPQRVTFTTLGVVDDDLFARLEQVEPWNLSTESWSNDVIPGVSGPSVLFVDWEIADIHKRVADVVPSLVASGRDGPWLEAVPGDLNSSLRVPPQTEELVRRLGMLATDLLPDFVDGSVEAHVPIPSLWDRMPRVLLEYKQRGQGQCADVIDAAGRGASRWMAAAVHIALRLVADRVVPLDDRQALARGELAGYVLLIDEPEAHLHPSAVTSVVRWCQRMVRHGATVIVGSHHEEFLKAALDDDRCALVHITRDEDLIRSIARTVPAPTVSCLLNLARDVGMHPAAGLALHRAILFVEGPLDEAVLDEYAGVRLDAAGVKIIPIHGTKNLEGIVSAEIVTGLGLKTGILTDATDPATMESRSNKKRSSEEKKVLRVLEVAARNGLPAPHVFGVPEEDLLFALPSGAISDYATSPFPGWKEMVAECRDELGKSPSESVDWKSFADRHYGLPISTTEGVRHLVRSLELAGVDLPSIRTIIDEVLEWAAE